MTRWRYIAQAVPSGEFLHWDLPLADVQIARTLSGPGRLTGKLDVPLDDLGDVLLPWGTAIWAEADSEIRGGGILTPLESDEDALTIDCVGISGYPQGMPWTGDKQALVDVDPLDIVRMVWDHLQSQPGGALGVQVDATRSPVRVGEPEREVEFTTGDDTEVTFEAGPYRLEWWSTHDLGRVIDDLAADTPFEYLEQTAWEGDALAHRLRLGYPTLGQRKTGPTAPRFALGENVTAVPVLSGEDDDYASDVLALGAGEGNAMVRAHLHRDGATGLRRVHVYTDKTARSMNALSNSARRELAWLTGAPRMQTLVVRDHPNAPLGSFDVGDEIFAEGASGWVTLDRWVRIVEITISPDTGDEMTLTVEEV